MKRSAKLLAAVSMFLVCTQPVNAESGWKKDKNGWWYEFGDGAYYAGTFAEIDGKVYCFDENGYMVTGWQYFPGSESTVQYYFTPNGELGRCQWVGKYWVNWDGIKAKDEWVDNYRYYVDENGKWDSSIPGLNTLWRKDDTGWWFDLGNGTYAQNGFYEIDRNIYVFDEKGYMVTGWYQDSYGYWYYLGSDGAVKCDQWVGDYYLDLYGYMAAGMWLENQSVYVDSTGKKAPGWQKDAKGWWFSLGADGYLSSWPYYIGGKTYQFDENGYMVTGWYSFDGSTWSFYNSDGTQKSNAWEGNYWLDENGIMARDQ